MIWTRRANAVTWVWAMCICLFIESMKISRHHPMWSQSVGRVNVHGGHPEGLLTGTQGGALSRAKTQRQGSGCLRGGQAGHIGVDRARLPCPLGHYGGEALSEAGVALDDPDGPNQGQEMYTIALVGVPPEPDRHRPGPHVRRRGIGGWRGGAP